MNDTAEIYYSRAYAYFALIIMVGLTSFLTYIVLTEDAKKWKGSGLVYLAGFALLLLFSSIYIIVRYLIPAVTKKSAIILNSEFIIDKLRNNKIPWNNVREIRSIYGPANFIAIDLINKREVTHQTKNIFKKILYVNNNLIYGTPILIPTQFIEGSNKELMEVFLSFFKRTRTAGNILLQEGG